MGVGGALAGLGKGLAGVADDWASDLRLQAIEANRIAAEGRADERYGERTADTREHAAGLLADERKYGSEVAASQNAREDKIRQEKHQNALELANITNEKGRYQKVRSGTAADGVTPIFSLYDSATGDMVDQGTEQQDPEIMSQARKLAEQYVKDKAGYLSSDSSDFADYGGSRAQAIAAKTAEFAAMLSGQTAAPQSGQATGQPPVQAVPPPGAIAKMQANKDNPEFQAAFVRWYGQKALQDAIGKGQPAAPIAAPTPEPTPAPKQGLLSKNDPLMYNGQPINIPEKTASPLSQLGDKAMGLLRGDMSKMSRDEDDKRTKLYDNSLKEVRMALSEGKLPDVKVLATALRSQALTEQERGLLTNLLQRLR